MKRNSPDFLNSSFPNHTCPLRGMWFSRHNFDLLQLSESLWMKSCLLKAGHYVYLILYLCFPLIECVVCCDSYFSFLQLVVVLTIVLLLFRLIFCEFIFCEAWFFPFFILIFMFRFIHFVIVIEHTTTHQVILCQYVSIQSAVWKNISLSWIIITTLCPRPYLPTTVV